MFLFEFLLLILFASLFSASVNSTYREEYLTLGVPGVITLYTNDVIVFNVKNISSSIEYVLFEIHTQNLTVNVSLTKNWVLGESISGDNVGVVRHMKEGINDCQFHVNVTENKIYSAVVKVASYQSLDPVPGGCSLESTLVINPNVNILSDSFIHRFHIASANVGQFRGQKEPDCNDPELQHLLNYDFYVLYLDKTAYDEDYFLLKISQMMSLDYVLSNARKFPKNYYGDEQFHVDLAALPGQDIIVNVVVSYINQTGGIINVPYVPAYYSCDFENEPSSCRRADYIPLQILICLLGAIGLFMCFFGHKNFIFGMFVFGFLFLWIVCFILISRFTSYTLYLKLAISCLVGIFGGLQWVGIWCFTGIPIVAVLLNGLTPGFILSSFIFNCDSLDGYRIFQENSSYGLSFASGILLLLVIGGLSPYHFSLFNSSFMGSFLVAVAVDFDFNASITYVILISLRKIIIPDFIQVYAPISFGINDCIILGIWIVLFVIGITIQYSQTKSLHPEFPVCPYIKYKTRRHYIQLSNSQQEHRGLLESHEEIICDRQPLLPEILSGSYLHHT